ncbi:unnamed protein product [Leptidea sinapis]|uniref:Uncharacterized protein n=1 Tax=Leptidea sinapis TaxID=189913 RepID=A0A5E4QBY7_9NEOP|nr:unnamed protein product [Leptidea sinapis]
MLVLKDRELKETRNLYSAVKDMLALQPSPEIQLSMREKQVSDLRLELERVQQELACVKQNYFDMKRALDKDEERRLRVAASPPAAAL